MVAATKAKKKALKAKLTRPMVPGVGKKESVDWTCQCHGLRVVERLRMREKEDGTVGFGGAYFGCPQYWECGYYVDAKRGVVPCTDGNGVALGRLI